MPIYEYLCTHCNRVYSFLAKSASETKEPHCPKCDATDLKKMVSAFSLLGGRSKTQPEDAGSQGGGDAMDDPRTEREMMRLMHDAEGIDENDPRQMGSLLRRMSEISGESLDGELGEAVKRLEAGEDPEEIEEEMGELFPEGADGSGSGGPAYDDGLYPM